MSSQLTFGDVFDAAIAASSDSDKTAGKPAYTTGSKTPVKTGSKTPADRAPGVNPAARFSRVIGMGRLPKWAFNQLNHLFQSLNYLSPEFSGPLLSATRIHPKQLTFLNLLTLTHLTPNCPKKVWSYMVTRIASAVYYHAGLTDDGGKSFYGLVCSYLLFLPKSPWTLVTYENESKDGKLTGRKVKSATREYLDTYSVDVTVAALAPYLHPNEVRSIRGGKYVSLLPRLMVLLVELLIASANTSKKEKVKVNSKRGEVKETNPFNALAEDVPPQPADDEVVPEATGAEAAAEATGAEAAAEATGAEAAAEATGAEEARVHVKKKSLPWFQRTCFDVVSLDCSRNDKGTQVKIRSLVDRIMRNAQSMGMVDLVSRTSTYSMSYSSFIKVMNAEHARITSK